MIVKYPAKFVRKYYKPYKKKKLVRFNDLIEYWDEAANELVKQQLLQDKPCMISKFGTTELSCMLNYASIHEPKKLSELISYVKRERPYLWWWETVDRMALLSGLFPATEPMAERFCKLMFEDIKEIDILGSYTKNELYFKDLLTHAKKINIEGYYAPYFFENPWTEVLAGKKVLVVHPFEESIQSQYKKRHLLFDNPKVLPQFELRTVKAVQTIANNKSEFRDWFEALDHMKRKIDATDYDIALIGCGAYGMPLAAHVKRMGKKAVHMAGWTQVLFGIYGRRWENSQDTARFINEHWVKPLSTEVPENHTKVELGAYW